MTPIDFQVTRSRSQCQKTYSHKAATTTDSPYGGHAYPCLAGVPFQGFLDISPNNKNAAARREYPNYVLIIS
ncbi:hypothetical protein DPMN_090954 [Dreissena polymorpha]|uniref:Uncharacterized protein n=1 Tax=Dreissena polymorpha TaxID=45954 RepID=A0A9D4L160_DREPO|nr:hypothetical protein DPMN_090954 [Dreissena polymorpha]